MLQHLREDCLGIILSSPQPRDPQSIWFSKSSRSVEEEGSFRLSGDYTVEYPAEQEEDLDSRSRLDGKGHSIVVKVGKWFKRLMGLGR